LSITLDVSDSLEWESRLALLSDWAIEDSIWDSSSSKITTSSSGQLMIANTHLGAHVLVDLIGVPGSSLRQSDASPSQLLDAVRQIKDGQWIDASLGNLASQILYVVGA